MQTTSALYQTIVSGSHYFETKVTIAGNDISAEDILNLKRMSKGMAENKPSIGGAIASELDLTIIEPSFSIPKMAAVEILARARNDTQTSEWLPQGTYFIDTRKKNDSVAERKSLAITAYDAMAKAEADYPDTSHEWPYLDISVVAEIASTIGVTVDSRTTGFLTAGYMIDLPIGYTMRETLEHIAGAYGGNFVITAENKLLFVPLYGLDPEESGSYLAYSAGAALTFGNEGWYILV